MDAFEQKAQCFIDQYSNFTVQGTGPEPLHVNGRLTLGENIADAGGISAAFHAWKKHDEASPDAHLPGLTVFSKEQLFFISYANWWCSKTSRQAAEKAIYNDPHAPKPARNNVSHRILSTSLSDLNALHLPQPNNGLKLMQSTLGYHGKFEGVQGSF